MSGYISELRKLVGRRPLIQCAASVLCIDAEGRLLLGRRTDNRLWGYSGGSAELDERAEDCARRELYEEMGLIADELEFYCVNSGPEAHYVYPNGDEVYNMDAVYLCRAWQGEPRPQAGEVEELRWFAPNALPAPLMPPNIPALEKYAELYGK